jgi:site-specific DNA-methyltransferase (adenine-specific)
MTAYYESENVTLYQGDALSILRTLPDGAADAVLTDPPYSSGGVTLSARQSDPAQKYQASKTVKQYPPMLGDGKDQRAFTAWVTLWLSECWRIAKDGAPLMLFTDWRQLPAMTDALQGAGWFWLGIVVWNKRSSRPQLGRFRQQCEYILFGSKGRFIPAHRICFPGVYDVPIITQAKVHLTSKPVPLVRELLAVSRPGGLVLDPFLGGGTTAVAALETGRRCIGIELSKDYAKIASERCEKAAQE